MDKPIYINGLLRGLHEAAKTKVALDWNEIVALCEWAISQIREVPGRLVHRFDGDADWKWLRQTMASLLDTGFRTATIPLDFRFRVWDVLVRLMADPDPTLEYKDRFGGDNMTPTMMSLNTVRGCTMHAIVHYALWIQQSTNAQTEHPEVQKTGLDLMPEV